MGRNILESEKALSSVVGVMLILAITILSITLLTLYSIPAYNEMEEIASTQRIEQGFTVFDSRTSKASLGESPIQSTRLSLMGGAININGDSDAYNESNIKVQILDNGAIIDEFTCPMGNIEYRKDGRIIAYEGGGVWSKYPTGKPVMISPPEFHYNGQTLTLPAMKVKGNSSFGGNSDAVISIVSDNTPSNIYPDKATKSTRVNPLYSDSVRVLIKSEFYEAWAEYANSTVYTYAIVDDANKTAILDLAVIPPSGASGTSALSTSFDVGMLNQSDPAPLEGFSMFLQDGDSSGLAPFSCELTAVSGDKFMQYTLDNVAKKIWVTLEYHDGVYEEYWKSLDGFPVDQGKYSCNVDYLNDTFMMEYDPGKLSNGSNPDYSWDEYVITQGNQSFSIAELTQHYMKLMTADGSVSFNMVEQQSKGKLNFETSTLTLDYKTDGEISYLHVTSNELDAVVV